MSPTPFKKKKSLGQNFLKSKGAVRTIVSSGDIRSGDTIVEIGPGKGALTSALLQTKASIIAVEKDDRLIPELETLFASDISSGKLSIVHGDILEIPIRDIVGNKPYKVIANIPYYITGLLFRKLLEEEQNPTRMVLLVQKEVAQRIVARDEKESILSLSIKAYGKAKIMDTVSRKMFSPQPNVDSAILCVSDISKAFFQNFAEKTFFAWIKAGFAQKRKKVIRNLESIAPKEKLQAIFTELSIDTNSRAEDISLSQWAKMVTLSK